MLDNNIVTFKLLDSLLDDSRCVSNVIMSTG